MDFFPNNNLDPLSHIDFDLFPVPLIQSKMEPRPYKEKGGSTYIMSETVCVELDMASHSVLNLGGWHYL